MRPRNATPPSTTSAPSCSSWPPWPRTGRYGGPGTSVTRYPPYGLVQSPFTQMPMVSVEPASYPEVLVTSFAALGRA